jgi:hypothetical protein
LSECQDRDGGKEVPRVQGGEIPRYNALKMR